MRLGLNDGAKKQRLESLSIKKAYSPILMLKAVRARVGTYLGLIVKYLM